MTSGIVIRWREAKEYIDIDFGRLKSHPPIKETREIWDDGTRVEYRTTSSVKASKDGSIVLSIVYERKKNRTLIDGASFGISRITLAPPYKEGRARWSDDSDPENNGTRSWKRLEGGLTKQKPSAQRAVRFVERKQAVFRELLIGFYGSCAVTGERTAGALEAAHIIPSRDGGIESIENGVLLRADLHRLYDAGAFAIDQNGKLKLVEGAKVSKKYADLIGAARVPAAVLKRVRLALSHRLAKRGRA